jgi:hypothetical protein
MTNALTIKATREEILSLNSCNKNTLRDRIRKIPASQLLAVYENAKKEASRSGSKLDQTLATFIFTVCDAKGIIKTQGIKV